MEVGGWKLEVEVGREIDDVERSAVGHDQVMVVLRREVRQARDKLPDILPAAGVGLIEEPAVDDDTHGERMKDEG
jgi:hypothetical protein